MRDYARIITKINTSLWLITPEGLNTVLSIVSERLDDGKLSEEELQTRLASFGGKSSSEDDGPKIINGVGILPVQGPIFGKANLMTNYSGATSMEAFQQDFRSLMANDSVDSIMMDFDTPGGTSDLIEEVGQEIYDARGTKPMYSCVNTMCGSAGLWLAMQADKVYSTPSGTVGSLGAYTVHQDQSVSDAQNGVKFTYISAGEYKTEGNPHQPLSAEAIQHRQEQVNELMDGFVGAVARGRNASTEHVRENYGKGRMLTPKKALEAGMIDGVASYDDILSGARVNRAQKVSIVVPNGDSIAATMIDGKITFMHGADDAAIMSKADIEAFAGQTLAIDLNRKPAITLPNPRKEDDTMNLSVEALTALGLSADATDEQVNAAILAQAVQANSFTQLKSTIDGKKKFADEYPEEYAMVMAQQAENKELKAKAFSDKYATIRFADIKVTAADDGTENKVVMPTTKGLSGLALEKIKMSTTKINEGSYQLNDFQDTLDSIMLGGIVDYGVAGSDTGVELEEPITITNNTFANRTLFATKVAEVEKKDGVDQDTAIQMVAQKHPELWAAYKNPIVTA